VLALLVCEFPALELQEVRQDGFGLRDGLHFDAVAAAVACCAQCVALAQFVLQGRQALEEARVVGQRRHDELDVHREPRDG